MLRLLARILCRVFFKNISISGTPFAGGSCIWAANHTSGIVDPAVMFGIAPSRLRPISKHTLWNHPVMRPLLNASGAIPIFRLQDMKKDQQAVRDAAVQSLPAGEMRAAQGNNGAFEAVTEALQAGDCVLIFPEGMSHDEPILQKLKTGIARMALQAMSRPPASNFSVVIQPVAIDYFEKDEFRSDLAVHFCEPIPVTSGDTPVEDLMEAVRASLLDGLATFTSWDEKRNWLFIFEIAYGRSPRSAREFRSFVDENRWKFESDPSFLARLQTMRRMLLAMNISPSHLVWGETNEKKISFFKLFITHGWFHFLISAPIQFFSNLMWNLPQRIVGILAHSSVKDRDVVATMKIAHGLYILPIAVFVGAFFWAWGLKFLMPEASLALRWVFGVFIGPALLVAGTRFAERTDFFSGYWRFARLRFFFPRGWREVMEEWRNISERCLETVNLEDRRAERRTPVKSIFFRESAS